MWDGAVCKMYTNILTMSSFGSADLYCNTSWLTMSMSSAVARCLYKSSCWLKLSECLDSVNSWASGTSLSSVIYGIFAIL